MSAGVWASLFFMVASDPYNSNISTHSTFPERQALCKGLSPFYVIKELIIKRI